MAESAFSGVTYLLVGLVGLSTRIVSISLLDGGGEALPLRLAERSMGFWASLYDAVSPACLSERDMSFRLLGFDPPRRKSFNLERSKRSDKPPSQYFLTCGHSPFEQGEASADFGKTTAMLKCSIFFGQAFPWHWYLWYFGGPQKHSAGPTKAVIEGRKKKRRAEKARIVFWAAAPLAAQDIGPRCGGFGATSKILGME
ncbi:hypothetical protein BU26DRAFT_510967 [Trematosphaeria pertusa]|uniref:Uncharacterized protein n=1 Tax=Trematosphaeria pertusa TaxID=390896 RepID=A0A6A6HW86_9PLEO|nr:uncharacterized protein BU26DRAFT_510967 [Trematosphaeria pertusa]KAF2242028.1 hypothetical protein BU26DRAFT_510967 [Trematosphaeria pertusa]